MSLSASTMGFIASFLCFAEFYNFLCHVSVLLRIRLLPRKDLVRQRMYFLIDFLSVFTTCFLVTDTAHVMAAIQGVQHLFYYFTWNKSALCRKVISWSSLDWFESPSKQSWAPLEVVGTIFDTTCHVVCVYNLIPLMSAAQAVTSMSISVCLFYAILFNSRFAWSFPYGNVPTWVKKRISPITGDMNPNYVSFLD